MLLLLQEGRSFNQARYDEQANRRIQQCLDKAKSDEEAEIYRKDLLDQMREEFLTNTDNKYRAARLREKVGAQLKLHEFALGDRRDRSSSSVAYLVVY